MITKKCPRCEQEIEVVYNYRSNKKWTRRKGGFFWFPREVWKFRFVEHKRPTRHVGLMVKCRASNNIAVSKPSKKLMQMAEDEMTLREIAR